MRVRCSRTVKPLPVPLRRSGGVAVPLPCGDGYTTSGRERERDAEPPALPGSTGSAIPVPFDDPLHGREADPLTVVIGLGMEPAERLEDLVADLRRNPDPIVGDTDTPPVLLPNGRDVDPGLSALGT